MPTAEQKLEEVRRYWDQEAVTFDQEMDHGLAEPSTRRAWYDLLVQRLPEPPVRVLDIGCGTGSLSLLLAEHGYSVTGIDLSPAMIKRARSKLTAAGYAVPLHIMNAAYPRLPKAWFDAILCRHLLWALPEPEEVLRGWIDLLPPGGYLLLIEGFWHTGGGLHGAEVVDLLPAELVDVSVENLSEQAVLWGKSVKDERYIVTARKIHD